MLQFEKQNFSWSCQEKFAEIEKKNDLKDFTIDKFVFFIRSCESMRKFERFSRDFLMSLKSAALTKFIHQRIHFLCLFWRDFVRRII